MNLMKKYLLAAAAGLACLFAVIATSSGQTATFSFNDGNGTPNAGTYNPTNSFTFSIMLNFAPGGTVANIAGLSYWFEQQSGAPFNFLLTNRDLSGSSFSVPQTPGAIFPQPLNAQNASDLGATLPGLTGIGGGSYFIANVTFYINANTAPGTYVIESTTNPGKNSVVSDDQGHTAAIARAFYTITVVPETGGTALFLGVGLVGLFGLRWRQQRA